MIINQSIYKNETAETLCHSIAYHLLLELGENDFIIVFLYILYNWSDKP